MEQIPDMDALLDEVENSIATTSTAFPDCHLPTMQTFAPLKLLETLLDEPIEQFEQEDERPAPETTTITPTPPPTPAEPEVAASQPLAAVEEPKVSEVVREETPPLPEQLPVEVPEADTSFEAALERYLSQFPDEEEQIEQEHKDVLLQAAETVAEEIFTGAMEGWQSTLFPAEIYTEAPIQKEEKDTSIEEPRGLVREQAEAVELAKTEEIEVSMRDVTIREEILVKEEEIVPVHLAHEVDVICVGEMPSFSGDEARVQPVVTAQSLEEASMSEEVLEGEEAATSEQLEVEDEGNAELPAEEIEVFCVGDQPASSDEGETESVAELAEDPAQTPSIATVHNLGQETCSRLTESELLLGKQKPYWIPDADCDSCMLCSAKFSLISRRHHCRACGRVLCSSCCNEKALLEYMRSEPKPAPARVCHPCVATLARIEQYERDRAEQSTSQEEASTRRGVLKSRTEEQEEGAVEQQQQAPANPPTAKRSVTFRDGVNPGSSSGSNVEEERSTAVKPKKKSKKRASVVRRVNELKLEDELESFLPQTDNDSFVLQQTNEVTPFERLSFEKTGERLRIARSITVLVRKNFLCHIEAAEVGEEAVWAVRSDGFAAVGQDEVLFVWTRKVGEEETVNMQEIHAVLERISHIFVVCLDKVQTTGVEIVSGRMATLFSVSKASYPLTKHVALFRPVLPYFGRLCTPSTPFLVAVFLHDHELPWYMACPQRVLFRLGLRYAVYPYPFVNHPDRESVYSADTNSTVLKVFTDFRSWSYRMTSIPGSTVTLYNDTTVIKIPREKQSGIMDLFTFNKAMLAWICDFNLTADTHLVCDETDGQYSTHVFSISDTREATGASFVILDGGLKTSSQLQVSVVEDGVAIRVQADQFRALCEAMMAKEPQDLKVKDAKTGAELRIEWVESDHNRGEYSIRSPIDDMCLEDCYQYGLSQERVLTSILEVQSQPGLGVRLSHVYNLSRGRQHLLDEPRFFSIVEVLSRESTSLLGPFLPMLLAVDTRSISLRFYAHHDAVEYDVSWGRGFKQDQDKYRESLDQLIPILLNCTDYLSGPLHVEFTLSFVSTAPPKISS